MAVTAAPASPLLSRRCVMAGIGAGLALPALSWLSQPAQAALLDELVLYGPPAGPSIVLAGVDLHFNRFFLKVCD